MSTQPPSQIGRYRIERELGRGTMGVVYQAQDTTLGRTVALKTFGAMAAIAPHERDAFEQRFLSEARISATLDNQNIVSVYDVGRDFESGLLFMALEFVNGETLASILDRGPLPWLDAANIAAKTARALQEAHVHHIVHRDIKPANIMLNTEGEPKIMDFGIAKANAMNLTVQGQVFGTPAYMSPEQASGEDVDGRSDVFSLGVVLYELVTRIRPFEGPTMAATLTKILRDEPMPASKVRDVPRALDSVIARALRKSRDSRYDSAWQFAEDLESLIEGKPPLHATQLTPLETLPLPKGEKGGAARGRKTTPPVRIPVVTQDGAGEAPPRITAPSKARLVAAIIVGITLGGGFVWFLQSRATPAQATGPGPAPVAAATTQTPPLSVPAAPQAPAPIAPRETPPPMPTATAVFLPSQIAGPPAQVYLELTHPFGSGSLRVKVDDKVLVANPVHGMPKRGDDGSTTYLGRYGTNLVIPAGSHMVRVEVRSGASEFAESIVAKLQPGQSKRLVAKIDKTMTLTFEDPAPVS